MLEYPFLCVGFCPTCTQRKGTDFFMSYVSKHHHNWGKPNYKQCKNKILSLLKKEWKKYKKTKAERYMRKIKYLKKQLNQLNLN